MALLVLSNLKDFKVKSFTGESSLAVQWLGLCALTAESPGSIPGQELRSHKLCGTAKKAQKTKNKKKPNKQKALLEIIGVTTY